MAGRGAIRPVASPAANRPLAGSQDERRLARGRRSGGAARPVDGGGRSPAHEAVSVRLGRTLKIAAIAADVAKTFLREYVRLPRGTSERIKMTETTQILLIICGTVVLVAGAVVAFAWKKTVSDTILRLLLSLTFVLAVIGSFLWYATTLKDASSFGSFWSDHFDAIWTVIAAILGGTAGGVAGARVGRESGLSEAETKINPTGTGAEAKETVAGLRHR